MGNHVKQWAEETKQCNKRKLWRHKLPQIWQHRLVISHCLHAVHASGMHCLEGLPACSARARHALSGRYIWVQLMHCLYFFAAAAQIAQVVQPMFIEWAGWLWQTRQQPYCYSAYNCDSILSSEYSPELLPTGWFLMTCDCKTCTYWLCRPHILLLTSWFITIYTVIHVHIVAVQASYTTGENAVRSSLLTCSSVSHTFSSNGSSVIPCEFRLLCGPPIWDPD